MSADLVPFQVNSLGLADEIPEVPSIGDAAPIVSQVPTLGLLSSVFSIRPRQGPPIAPDGGFPSLPAGPRGELSLQCRVDFSSAMRAVSRAMSSP